MPADGFALAIGISRYINFTDSFGRSFQFFDNPLISDFVIEQETIICVDAFIQSTTVLSHLLGRLR